MLRLSYDPAAPLLLIILAVVSLIQLASCGGMEQSAGGADQGNSTAGAAYTSRHQVAWSRLEQSPGIPGHDFDPGRIVVAFKPGAELPGHWHSPGDTRYTIGAQTQQARASQQPNPQLRRNRSFEPLTDALAQRYGLTISQQVYIEDLNFASFELPAQADGAAVLGKIRTEAAGMLQGAIFCPLRRAAYIPNDPDFYAGPEGKQWSHWRVGCNLAWEYGLGSPEVIIGIIDTGVRLSHEQLLAQVINPETEFPAATCDLANNDKSIEDSQGHGTFIAGTICAAANDDKTICGVAPGCRALPVKISNDLAAPLDKLITGALLAADLGARVINYSWGGPQSVPLEEQMVNQLTADGVLFVCSAGNEASDAVEYPSAFVNAMSVGATNKDDNRADFSNFHSSIDVVAPGVDMKACIPNSDTGYLNSGEGTSFSTPMVAAAAGLLWSYRPELSLSQLRAALEQHGPLAGGFVASVRRLDIAAALDSVAISKTPSLGGLLYGGTELLGIVPARPQLVLSVNGAVNVSRVEYRLDLDPVGVNGPEDFFAQSQTAPFFNAQLDLGSLRNQNAQLGMSYFGLEDEKLAWPDTELWIFNQRGDTNADGAVNAADLQLLQLALGSSSGEPSFNPFADSDLDGLITEADAAAVGYSYLEGVSAPAILSVQPLSGYSGSSATLTATLTGGGALTYSWDFGGGAVPNSSELPAPTVSLGAAGSYNANLSVSNELGSDSFEFTIEVLPASGPVAQLSADHSAGRPPVTIGFSADGSQSPGESIVLYEWSWDGDTVFEDSTFVAAAQHEFTSLGEHTVRLRITDSAAATAEATTTVSVVNGLSLADWQTTVLGPFGYAGSGDNTRLASGEVAGCPAAAWVFDDPDSNTSSVYVAVARVPAPQLLSDWRVDAVFSGSLRESIGICDIEGEAAFVYGNSRAISYGRYHGDEYSNHIFATTPAGVINNASLVSLNDRPAVLFKCYSGSAFGDNVAFALAQGPRPKSELDWQVNGLSGLPLLRDPLEQGYQLFVAGDRPCFAHEEAAGGLAFCYGDSASPDPGDWVALHFSGNTDAQQDYISHVFDIAGRPGLLYNYFPGGQWALSFAQADNASPASVLDFSQHQPEPLSQPILRGAAMLDGRPAFALEDGAGASILLAQTVKPAAAGDWLPMQLPAGLGGNRRLLSHGGMPALLAVDSEGNVVYRFPLP